MQSQYFQFIDVDGDGTVGETGDGVVTGARTVGSAQRYTVIIK